MTYLRRPFIAGTLAAACRDCNPLDFPVGTGSLVGMDLRERGAGPVKRHPWEKARLAALGSLLNRVRFSAKRPQVLDIGCGDVYTSSQLFGDREGVTLTGVDPHLTDEEIAELTSRSDDAVFFNGYEELESQFYDLALLLDVLEHVEDDLSLLRAVVGDHLRSDGHVLITVPAFQRLFSSHDRYLNHVRRYNREELLRVTRDAGLECVSSGYLFSSLLVVRGVLSGFERLRPGASPQQKGIGAWNHGKLVSGALEAFLRADNWFTIHMNRIGAHVPGLSVWALCRKPQ